MSAPSVGKELRKYRALAWAMVITLVVSVGLFLHFLKIDHIRVLESFWSNAAHAATISTMRIGWMINRLETIGHDYLLMDASNAQLTSMMHTLGVDASIASLCVRHGERASVLHAANGDTLTATGACTEDFKSLDTPVPLSGKASISTDFQVIPQLSGDEHSLGIRFSDHQSRELRAVLDSSAMLDAQVLRDAGLTMGNETICLSVRVNGVYKELTCHLGEAPDAYTPPGANDASLIEEVEAAGLHWRIVITPKLASLAGEITLLPFVMFGAALSIGIVVCVYAYQSADKNIQLEARADELSARLEQVGLLKEQNSMLDQFAAMAAHDLQAPLRFMVSNAHLLIEELDEMGQSELSQLAVTQVEQGERMRSLVLDLLEFCRAGQSTLTLAPVDTRTLVDEEVRLLKMHEEYTGTQIIIGPLPNSLTCDVDKFKHIIRNLLGNAVKFSQMSAVPKVSISATRDTFHAPWTFCIKDNGPGVAAEHHERIFRPFARLDSKTKGTGMGLAIVKIMVDRHGGTIWLDTKGSQGSNFYFTMPGATPKGITE